MVVLHQSNSTFKETSFEAKKGAPFWCKCHNAPGANGASQHVGRYWWVHRQKWCQHAITCSLCLHQGGENVHAPKIPWLLTIRRVLMLVIWQRKRGAAFGADVSTRRKETGSGSFIRCSHSSLVHKTHHLPPLSHQTNVSTTVFTKSRFTKAMQCIAITHFAFSSSDFCFSETLLCR